MVWLASMLEPGVLKLLLQYLSSSLQCQASLLQTQLTHLQVVLTCHQQEGGLTGMQLQLPHYPLAPEVSVPPTLSPVQLVLRGGSHKGHSEEPVHRDCYPLSPSPSPCWGLLGCRGFGGQAGVSRGHWRRGGTCSRLFRCNEYVCVQYTASYEGTYLLVGQWVELFDSRALPCPLWAGSSSCSLPSRRDTHASDGGTLPYMPPATQHLHIQQYLVSNTYLRSIIRC